MVMPCGRKVGGNSLIRWPDSDGWWSGQVRSGQVRSGQVRPVCWAPRRSPRPVGPGLAGLRAGRRREAGLPSALVGGRASQPGGADSHTAHSTQHTYRHTAHTHRQTYRQSDGLCASLTAEQQAAARRPSRSYSVICTGHLRRRRQQTGYRGVRRGGVIRGEVWRGGAGVGQSL